MESLANRRWIRIGAGVLAMTLLLSSAVVVGDDEPLLGCLTCDDCYNSNLYWHGQDGCWLSGVPRWYAAVDMLALRRDIDSLDDRGFAFEDTGAGMTEQRLGSSDFKDEFDAGARVTVGYALNDWYRLEGLYYGSYNFDGDMFLRTPGANDLTFVFGDTGSFNRLRFTSRLDNAELNLRQRLDMPPGPLQVSLLWGGRFMRMDETFSYESDGAVVSNVDVATSNDMLGLQIGLLAQWQTHPMSWLDYEIKGAVLTNRASQDTRSNVAPAMGTEQDVTSFSVDMSLVFNCQLTPNISLRFGYYSMWLDGVALGVENVQSNVNLLTLGPPKLIHSGTVVYHGPSFGIVLVR